MRLLADENFPRQAVDALRAMGHDVLWIRIDAPGIPDTDVVDLAQKEQRVILTLDKDFGELAFRAGLSANSGVILFRLFPPLPATVVDVVTQAFVQDCTFEGEFVVIEKDRIRRRRLPE